MRHFPNIVFVGLFTVLLIVVAVHWHRMEDFFCWISGFERVIDIGAPFVKDLIQETRNTVLNPSMLTNILINKLS
jgi:hypothetical protein